MSISITAIFEELQNLVLAAVPECVNGGIWSVTQIQRVPFERLKDTLPYGVIELDRMDGDSEGEYGALSNSFTFSPALWVVQKQTGSGFEVAATVEKIRDAFAQYEGENFQFLSFGSLDWGDDLEPNQFFDSKNVTSRAARLIVNLQVGESLNG